MQGGGEGAHRPVINALKDVHGLSNEVHGLIGTYTDLHVVVMSAVGYCVMRKAAEKHRNMRCYIMASPPRKALETKWFCPATSRYSVCACRFG